MTEKEFDIQSGCVTDELKTIVNLTEDELHTITMFCTIYKDRFCTDNYKEERK